MTAITPIRIKDIARIRNCSYRSAQRVAKKIRSQMGKRLTHDITADDYAKHFNVPLDKVLEAL